MKKNHTISIVMPNWNGRHLLEKNLPSIITAFQNDENNIVEIIVVDDGSADDSTAFLKKAYTEVRIVQHSTNRGFSAAVNSGVKSAKGDLVCLLNTDVIPEKDFLKNIPKHFTDPEVFAVGLHEKGYGPSTGQFVDGYLRHSGTKPYKNVHISLWASGGSAVFRKKIWWMLHGLDEELFSPFYWEDLDIGYRAWKHGYQILWEPTAHVVHAHESVINTSNFKKKYMSRIKERNELLFIWKNIHSNTLFKKHQRAILQRILRHPGYIRIVWMALQRRSIVMRKRIRERKESCRSDEAVFVLFRP